ncbi:hypothetical protein AB0K43_11765 [Kitasatospora sp. NPDC049258]|uniref:hypothetical protein n=1 Tax=Kitasatospora sp. NPDC049258 TaxID=3155394 RepID=UPI00342843D0
MSSNTERLLPELHESLGQRKRPEDVAQLIGDLFRETQGTLDGRTARALEKATRNSLRNLWHGYTSLREEFARPVGAQRHLAVAAALFESATALPAAAGDDPAQLEAAIRAAGEEIGKEFGRSDFHDDRLNREDRAVLGLAEISKRQYNKRFRLLRRMEAKLAAVVAEQRKREITMIGKSGLASRLPYELFAADPGTAAFIAYLTARGNLRSRYTVDGQRQAYDEVAAALFHRLDPATAGWFAIAHVHPTAEVLERVCDEQRGLLLGRWYGILLDVAERLESLWEQGPLDRELMVVRRGDDSSGWNQAAGAWSKARANWFALLEAMGAQDVLARICPGKVLKLVAADVAYWHRRTGGGLHPDTDVWAELPLPWEVLRGEAQCPQWLVEQVCRRNGVEPELSGWTRARRVSRAVPFQVTPELVHGVTVADPMLATLFRAAGVFSGRALRPAAAEIR